MRSYAGYMVEFDGIDGAEEKHYATDNLEELIEWVENDLRELGGGHADIFDEWTGDYVAYVEI